MELLSISWFLVIHKKNEKLVPKVASKVIVDAERNRHPLEKPANHFPWCGGGTIFGAEGKVGCCFEVMTGSFKP